MSHRTRWSMGFISVSAMLSVGSIAAAQANPEVVQRLERQMRETDSLYRVQVPSDQPIAERLLFEWGGGVRFSFYGIDAPDGETRILRAPEAFGYLRAELDGAHRFYGRIRGQYNDWNTGDSFDRRGDRWTRPAGDLYFYQFDLAGAQRAASGEAGPFGLNITAGKQFVQWGTGLTLSNKLYALKADMEYGGVGLIALGGLTPSSDTVDFDGSRPGFDSDTDRAFYGAMLECRAIATHRPYISFLAQQDHNERDFEVFSTPLDDYPTRFEYDSYYVSIGSRGSFGASWRYGVELIHEFGETLSNSFDPATGLAVTQTKDDIEAWAAIASLTYLFRDAHDVRLDFEVVAGSGDSDRIDSSDTFGGNQPNTDDESFNALGFANTGLALAPEPANLLSFKVGASASPFKSVRWLRDSRIGINGFIFFKIDEDAPINVRTENEQFVGGEVDLYFDWKLTSDVSFNLRYGVFLPGEAMPDGFDDPRHFVFAGVTYAF